MTMTMTQKDFEEIAEAVAEAKREAEYKSWGSPTNKAAALVTLEDVTRELSTACAKLYKGAYGFNRSQFVTACGFPEA